jgi:hypothetical protein
MYPGGGPWDFPGEGGANPDPFCQFEETEGVVDETAGVTTTVVNSVTASWNLDDGTVTPLGGTVSAATLMSAQAPWLLWVGDEDCDFLGCFGEIACEIRPPMPASWLESGGFRIDNVSGCVSASFQLICESPPLTQP